MKTKWFDCLDMKKQVQTKLMHEYENRKGEFDSYVDFINSTAETDPFVIALRKKHGIIQPASKRRRVYSKTGNA
jgi:hypothetical protein